MGWFRRSNAAPTAESGGTLHTAGGTHSLQVRFADSFWRRLRGLMLTRALACGHGLLIKRCTSVHTSFMRYALDLVYLDTGGCVVMCKPRVKPWRLSFGGRAAVHCIELGPGSIDGLGIRPGDRFLHTALEAQSTPAPLHRQKGAAMVEFIIVGPILTLLGLAIVQYGMLFFAKNQINHATFMAARAGSTGNARMEPIRAAYSRNLMTLYGGGTDSAQLNVALLRAEADVGAWAEVTMPSPTRESFDDWNDPQLQRRNGARTIPNSGQAFRDLGRVGATSGQTIQDANLIKVRVMHGYEPKVPLMRLVFTRYLRWLDPRTDARYTAMVNANRIPVISHAVVQMQSDAIEEAPVSSPGPGNGGRPTNPGDPPVTSEPPPSCGTAGCTVPPGTLPQPSPCDASTDPGGCLPPGCRAGDPSCDPSCPPGACCPISM